MFNVYIIMYLMIFNVINLHFFLHHQQNALCHFLSIFSSFFFSIYINICHPIHLYQYHHHPAFSENFLQIHEFIFFQSIENKHRFILFMKKKFVGDGQLHLATQVSIHLRLVNMYFNAFVHSSSELYWILEINK